jgi:Uma2 family endonuclease
VGPEWRFRIGHADDTKTEFVPDLAYISKERLRALAPEDREEPPFAPDIAVEVRSPSSRPGLREKKIARYLATGAKIVLDVDPATRLIHVHDAEGVRTLACGQRFTHPEALWLAFDVSEAFADLDDIY